MLTSLTKQDLLDFEQDIADEFDAGKIKAPVHLYYGNEEAMLRVFEEQDIGVDDFVCCTWRSHYQCLLKGVPPTLLKQSIMEGRSIGLCFPEYRVYSSGIVTGSIPISVGIAMDIKRRGGHERVFCFVGDMAAETGSFYENVKYANNFELPILFIVEDNGVSVCTDTKETWGKGNYLKGTNMLGKDSLIKKTIRYNYRSKWPHAGAGSRVQF